MEVRRGQGKNAIEGQREGGGGIVFRRDHEDEGVDEADLKQKKRDEKGDRR